MEANREKSGPYVSLIIPCKDEEESVDELVAEVFGVIEKNAISAEVIIVDDGSRDKSWEKLLVLAAREPRLKLVRLRRNFGQTAAMVAAIDHARGEIIIPLDADLQNDPASVPALLAKVDEGFDVVSGWRKERKDKLFMRRIPSMLANKLISWVSGVHLHDYGCTLKAYRKEVLDPVNLYGEMHRFIPIYASWAGAKVTEVVVNHRARKYGSSKYGIGRTFKVLLDLIVVKFLGTYGTKPIYFFGLLAALLFAGGFLSASWVLWEKYINDVWAHRNPFLVVSIFMMSMGVQSIFMGLLAEIGMRTYHESQMRTIYIVKDRANLNEGARRKGESSRPFTAAVG